MNTTTSARQYTNHNDLGRTGKVGDFAQIVAEAGILTDRIAAVRTDNGTRVVTLEMVMVDHHKGVYRRRIERMTELHSPAGGRRVQPGGALLSEQTEPEPLDQDRLRQLHDELLNR